MPFSRRDAVAGLTLAPFIGATRLFAASDETTDSDTILKRAFADLQAKTAANVRLWQMDTASWSADLDLGTITFTNARHWTITGPVQVIGTRSTTDGTWLWGWDHPSVPAPLAAHARLVRDFGVAPKLEDMTTRKIEADKDRCWLYAALACYLGHATGAYRGPAGKAEVFMTFGEIRIGK